jgi:hypothetical protein
LGFRFCLAALPTCLRAPQVVEGWTHLGYPMRFVILPGIWKVLGGVAILLPGFALLKEWAYTGMIFDLTGAAVAPRRR